MYFLCISLNGPKEEKMCLMTSNLDAIYTYSLLLMFEEGAVRSRLESTVHFICMLPIGLFSVCFSYHSVSALLLSYKVEYGRPIGCNYSHVKGGVGAMMES